MPSLKLCLFFRKTPAALTPQRDPMSMASSYPFPPYLFDINTWNLQDNSSVNNKITFIRSFTHDIIHPNDGQDAPPGQASAFIELVADPKVCAVVHIAMPELWSNESDELAQQNPWVWAMRSVTKPLVGGGNTGYDGQTETQRRTMNTAAVVVAVLNILQESAGLERLREIDVVKRVFAARLIGHMAK